MNIKPLFSLVSFVLLLGSAASVSGQGPAPAGASTESPIQAVFAEAVPQRAVSPVVPALGTDVSCGHQSCGTGACLCDPSTVFGPVESAVLVGAEFLYIRPHFSEAIAFARSQQTFTSFAASGRELEFNYQPSFRVHLGYQFDGGQRAVLTYWNYDGDTDVTGRPVPGQFLVDPFGNTAGLAINPATLTVLPSGDLISTRAEVEMDVIDADLLFPLVQRGPVQFLGVAGVRVAWVDQYYESVVTLGGAPFARGDFAVDFTGAGPHLGSQLVYALTGDRSLTLHAKATGSLLVGEYDVDFSNTTAFLSATQRESITKTIPVLDAEIGLDWHVRPNLKLTGGWIFQSWFDLGTSGGTFGGFFNGADDSNIMSFEGLKLGAELSF